MEFSCARNALGARVFSFSSGGAQRKEFVKEGGERRNTWRSTLLLSFKLKWLESKTSVKKPWSVYSRVLFVGKQEKRRELWRSSGVVAAVASFSRGTGRKQQRTTGGEVCARCRGFQLLVSECLRHKSLSLSLSSVRTMCGFPQVVSKGLRLALRTGFEFQNALASCHQGSCKKGLCEVQNKEKSFCFFYFFFLWLARVSFRKSQRGVLMV